MVKLTEYSNKNDYLSECNKSLINKFIKYLFNEVWTKKNIGILYNFCIPSLKSFSGSRQLQYSDEEYIKEIIYKLAAFPNIKVQLHETITSGNEKDGYKTSTRWTMTGKHHGPSIYSDESGQQVTLSGVSHKYIKIDNHANNSNNPFQGIELVENYTLYNELQLASQLNMDPGTLTNRLHASSYCGEEKNIRHIERRIDKDNLPTLNLEELTNSPENIIKSYVNEVLNQRYLDSIHKYCSASFKYNDCEENKQHDVNQYQNYLLMKISMFPDCKFHIDEIIYEKTNDNILKTSVRWTFLGTHEGYGKYGPPTGSSLYLRGISHYHIKEDKFKEKWSFYNELDTLKSLKLCVEKMDEDINEDKHDPKEADKTDKFLPYLFY
ncbi:ester cyclase [Priestia megaterium]|uniref:nuclear transport factor 2 family protein n=1 Tax=Priestia megaterium TaxID=1404 RepID=UPI00366E6F39